jgi:hypothetical protein
LSAERADRGLFAFSWGPSPQTPRYGGCGRGWLGWKALRAWVGGLRASRSARVRGACALRAWREVCASGLGLRASRWASVRGACALRARRDSVCGSSLGSDWLSAVGSCGLPCRPCARSCSTSGRNAGSRKPETDRLCPVANRVDHSAESHHRERLHDDSDEVENQDVQQPLVIHSGRESAAEGRAVGGVLSARTASVLGPPSPSEPPSAQDCPHPQRPARSTGRPSIQEGPSGQDCPSPSGPPFAFGPPSVQGRPSRLGRPPPQDRPLPRDRTQHRPPTATCRAISAPRTDAGQVRWPAFHGVWCRWSVIGAGARKIPGAAVVGGGTSRFRTWLRAPDAFLHGGRVARLAPTATPPRMGGDPLATVGRWWGRNMQKALTRMGEGLLTCTSFVAGTGFEPATSGL